MSSNLEIRLDLGGMSAEGKRPLSRPLQEEQWSAPKVHRRIYENEEGQECLRIRLTGGGGLFANMPQHTGRRSDQGVLDSFVRLADAQPNQIHRFALRFGALEFCVHGEPLGHRPFLLGPLGGTGTAPCWRPTSEQPVELYRDYAREARAVLRAASAVHQKKPVQSEDWKILWVDRMPQRAAKEMQNPASVRFAIEGRVNDWLSWGSVAPRLHWEGDLVDVRLSGRGLWGALARQLTFTVARVKGLAMCHGCGKAYIPSRKPATGSDTWCPGEECQKAARRQAQREYRQRMKTGTAKRKRKT